MPPEKPEPSVNPADDGLDIEPLDRPPLSAASPGCAVMLIVMVLGVAFLAYLFVAMHETIQAMPRSTFVVVSVELLGGVILLAGLIGVGFSLTLWGRRTACPYCRRWWAKVYTGHEVLRRRKCRTLAARLPGTEPDPHDRRTWRRQVPAIRCIAEVFYQCPYCGETWSDARTGEVKEATDLHPGS